MSARGPYSHPARPKLRRVKLDDVLEVCFGVPSQYIGEAGCVGSKEFVEKFDSQCKQPSNGVFDSASCFFVCTLGTPERGSLAKAVESPQHTEMEDGPVDDCDGFVYVFNKLI